MSDAEELVRPLSGADWWNVAASGEVAAFRVSDGPSGVRGQRFAGGPPSVSFPCGAALGATWDVDLVARVGAALAEEARAKGAHVVLGPTVNLQRTPVGGRHFECFSEDPLLSAVLAAAYVEGLQGQGVAACVKHLVANDQEHDRLEVSCEPDERTLREVSLLPFEHALRGAGAWSTMAAYNRLHGTHCSEHERLLTTILRDEWAWDGVVISDWFAVHATVEPALAGLDLEMPGPALHWGAALAAAVDAGDVPVEVVEAKRSRLARLGSRTGADQRTAVDDQPGGSASAVAIAREAAVSAFVLLRNDGVLPLPTGLRSVAVVGPNADREVIQGGGSARVTPTDVATVADGLRERLGPSVAVEPGPSASRGTPALDGADLERADGTRGVDVEILGGDDEVRARLRPRDFRVMFLDDPGATATSWSARASASYRPRVTGLHRFKVKTNGDATLTVDGEPIADTVALTAGQPVRLELVVRLEDPTQRLAAEVRCAPPEAEDALERAVAAAGAADAAVVVIGLDGDWETEGRDRDSLALPGRQVELVEAVVAVQPRTAVVVLAGSPVDLSWSGSVPALLWGWLPGQEGGRAIADVLLGDAEPGGRLPCTFPWRLEDTPSFLDAEPGVLRYPEGVFTGHRWYDARGIEPAFPFGFGLGYTTWALSTPVVPAPIGAGEVAEVRVRVANTGGRHGSTVVQVYVGHPGAAAPSPVRQLRAFEKVALDPGGSRELTFSIGMRDLARWDQRGGEWVADAGEHLVWVGTSSREVGEPATLVLTERWSAPASAPLGA
ncbi:MAG: beta-glucosidase family protein [Acidimicrobiales bacterium]